MSFSNTFENSLALLLFNNTNIANFGDATGIRGSTAAGSFYYALHTADPGEAGSAVTSEAAYTNYARVAVARSGSGFSVSGSATTPVANVDFPQSGAGSNEVETHFSIVNTASGAGIILASGIIGSGPKPFTADAASDLITSPAHGFATDDRIVFEAIEGLSLPTGITQGTRYFVLATGLTTDAFKISTTSGGSAVDVTVSGGGLLYKSTAITVVGSGVTPRLTTATTVTIG
jgi:hypothetical protein